MHNFMVQQKSSSLMGNNFYNAIKSGSRSNLALYLLPHLHLITSLGCVLLLHDIRNMLPEVGDLQRSSDVAEPSLMSHKPAAQTHKPTGAAQTQGCVRVCVFVCVCMCHCPLRQNAEQTAAAPFGRDTQTPLITARGHPALSGAGQSPTPDAPCMRLRLGEFARVMDCKKALAFAFMQ